ncbi:hypothetical protein EHS13_02690 [Paenibacillus psychroresistens]|uniref:Orotidine 5'-phosphate decarboxylase n=1 Tax=Paenibacillus psychroresistens TaxID=1778678 RepID=A0A6B8RCG3_9BACL|nr:orotidine 5'-phosphate decarboxylase / HUMPS family protein [Paenibacillus psychroresistens]QGQ93890.1 hypothetical protein EHS13_02690 [Paenibacillus psychroresistens]
MYSSNESIADAIYYFNKIIIDAVADHVIAVKPQLAYYEVYGSYGIRALEKTISYARSKDLIVINDVKRGDIGSTSTAYARAFLGNGTFQVIWSNLAEQIEELASKTVGINNYSFIGAVVGATYPEEAKRIRKTLPHSIFLVPGFGMQGGKAEDLGVFFDENGIGAVISSSRGIIYSYLNQDEAWKKITKTDMFRYISEAAIKAKEQINEVRFTSSARI